MQEVFEKIVAEIERRKVGIADNSEGKWFKTGLDIGISIIKEVAVEYKNGWIPIIKEKPVEKGEQSVSYPDGTVSIQYWDGKFFTEVDTVSGKSIIGQPVAWKQKYEPHRPCTDEEPKIQTNADRIRSMSDEELAEIILCPYDKAGKPAHIMPCVKDGNIQELVSPEECKACMMKWLQSEVEEQTFFVTSRK